MYLTTKQKNELIAAVTALLEKMIPVEEDTPTITVSKPVLPEMLTIKECAALVSGLTEHTVRMLVKQDKVKYIRCGQGARGKILVSKENLLKYLGAVCA
jgi:phenylpyruvate tautomerase PptA (4-oxalocrotonate tautomerase family)